MLGSEDHFWDPVLSFDPVSSKDEAQVARLGGTATAESSSQPRNELLLPPEDTAIESKSACTHSESQETSRATRRIHSEYLFLDLLCRRADTEGSIPAGAVSQDGNPG